MDQMTTLMTRLVLTWEYNPPARETPNGNMGDEENRRDPPPYPNRRHPQIKGFGDGREWLYVFQTRNR